MEEIKLSEFYAGEKSHSVTVDKLKFWLMPFVFFVLLGFPTKWGGYVQICSNFAAPAFFILCGFFNLHPVSEVRIAKIKKAIWRTFIFCIIMFVSYIAINVIYLVYSDSLNRDLAMEVFRKKSLFNFFVLNIWLPIPMGSSFWFIHSLLYAYIFFFICEKLKLSRFYVPVLIALYVIMLATGEFAAIFRFPHFGYNYIPGNAFTRAIPYMIIGMLIRRFIDKIGDVPRFVYAISFFAGLALALAEFQLLWYLNMLVYINHTIGFSIMAVSVCCFALVNPAVAKRSFYANHTRNYVRRLYALCQPVALFIFVVGPFIYPPFIVYYNQYGSIVAFIVCFLISLTVGTVKHTIMVKDNNMNH